MESVQNKTQYQLLVVDDDPLVHQSIRLILPTEWHMLSCYDPLNVHLPLQVHCAFVDMHYRTPEKSILVGPTVIGNIKNQRPTAEVVGISGDLSMDLMESCLEHGASRFIAKPLNQAEIISHLEKTEAYWRLISPDHSMKGPKWVGSGPISEKLLRDLSTYRGERGPFLIEGESGSGKEVIAHLINSQEGPRPFITTNVASLSESLFESELFGHVKGAFTGADQNKVGLVEIAQDGDLFLDEIETLTLSQQAKLLRFLESGEFKKVGATKTQKSNCRIIAATNRNLEEMIRSGEFREDLFFRLKNYFVKVPPLRERASDVADLASHFFAILRPRNELKLSPESIDILKSHSWPGNVRELRRLCEQLAVKCPLPIVRAMDLKPLMSGSSIEPESIDLKLGMEKLISNFEKQILKKALAELPSTETCLETLQISKSSFYKKLKDHELMKGSGS